MPYRFMETYRHFSGFHHTDAEPLRSYVCTYLLASMKRGRVEWKRVLDNDCVCTWVVDPRGREGTCCVPLTPTRVLAGPGDSGK